MKICINLLIVAPIVVLLFAQLMVSSIATLIANINSNNPDSSSPLKIISFCVDCPSPQHEGSLVNGLAPKYGIKEYSITGEVVYCIPNHAEKQKLVNSHLFNDRIVFVHRGQIALLEKVKRLQHAGAAGVIIAEDLAEENEQQNRRQDMKNLKSSCDENFNFCSKRFGSIRDGGFAFTDSPDSWHEVQIPVLFVTWSTTLKLRDLMNAQKMKIPRIGSHYVTVLRNILDGSEEL